MIHNQNFFCATPVKEMKEKRKEKRLDLKPLYLVVMNQRKKGWEERGEEGKKESLLLKEIPEWEKSNKTRSHKTF